MKTILTIILLYTLLNSNVKKAYNYNENKLLNGKWLSINTKDYVSETGNLTSINEVIEINIEKWHTNIRIIVQCKSDTLFKCIVNLD